MDIFNIPAWAATTLYEEDSIVLVNNLYYYSKTRHTSAAPFATDLAASKWGGVLAYNGEQRPFFDWKPSYGYRVPIKPLVNTIKYGDGYAQDLNDSISNNL